MNLGFMYYAYIIYRERGEKSERERERERKKERKRNSFIIGL